MIPEISQDDAEMNPKSSQDESKIENDARLRGGRPHARAAGAHTAGEYLLTQWFINLRSRLAVKY